MSTSADELKPGQLRVFRESDTPVRGAREHVYIVTRLVADARLLRSSYGKVLVFIDGAFEWWPFYAGANEDDLLVEAPR